MSKFKQASLVALIIILLDQITKWLAKAFLPQEGLFVTPRVLELKIKANPGIAFGININPFIFYPLVIILFILLYLAFKNSFPKALSLIIGGAISNIIDRIYLGHVVDFINFQIWSVFNLADLAIIVGAVILIFKALKGSKPLPFSEDRPGN